MEIILNEMAFTPLAEIILTPILCLLLRYLLLHRNVINKMPFYQNVCRNVFEQKISKWLLYSPLKFQIYGHF